jgi:hypothetical protein
VRSTSATAFFMDFHMKTNSFFPMHKSQFN